MTTRQQVRDQTIGKTQAAGIAPSTTGIARKRLVSDAINRAVDAADTIRTILAARDSADPTSQEIARRLLANKEFVGAMSSAIEKIKTDVKSAMVSTPAVKDAPKGADYPESGAANKGSGLPGADSNARPGSYSKDQLLRDIATQNATAAKLAYGVGVVAADARVGSAPLVPPWDSPVWSADARAAFRARAASDGWAAEHIRNKAPSIEKYLSE